MDLETMKRKYAYTLARVGLNVQKGQTVLVEAAIEGWQFARLFAEAMCIRDSPGSAPPVRRSGRWRQPRKGAHKWC